MSELELHFLGDLKIVRDQQELPLPPSKKTRALLAYLVLNPQPHRRDTLCELLWEIPDDPRGSLRWSLSKLRRLVDDEDHIRIVADRNHVRFDLLGAKIDSSTLITTANADFATVSTDTLKNTIDNNQGRFLEGLELDKFHQFYLWRLNEREKVEVAQCALIEELITRLSKKDGLNYIRQLATLRPDDIETHCKIIERLVELGRNKEADQHFSIAQKLLIEYGVDDQGKLQRSLYRPKKIKATAISKKVESDNKTVSVNHNNQGDSTHSKNNTVESNRPNKALIGRDTEINSLVSLYESICSQSIGKLVLLRGEPGMGKSRLLQTARRIACQADAWLLEADAFESEIVRPFGLWSDAFRRSTYSETPPILADDQNVSRDSILSGINDMIVAQLDQHPVIIIFDDVHWCDESSAAALHYIVRMNRHRQLMVVIAARNAELETNFAMNQTIRGIRSDELLHEITLKPLTEHALQRIIFNRQPDADATQLSKECGGNPLLAIELARANCIDETGGDCSLTHLITERLSHIDHASKEVLFWAAVLDPRIELHFFSRVTNIDTFKLSEALELGVQRGILVHFEQSYRFSHDLIRRCIYDQLPTARKQLMHRCIAELLEADTAVDLSIAADTSHHAEKSGDAALAARAMVSAGRLCLRFFANDDAYRLAEKGLNFALQLVTSERVCISIELNDIKWKAAPLKDWQAAADQAVNLAEQALDCGALAHARMGYQIASYLRWENGDWTDAKHDSLQAERVTRSGNEKDHVHGVAEAARCLALLERDLSRADAMLMEASAIAKRKNIRAAVIPLATGMLHYYRNEMDNAEECLQEARSIYKSNGDRINEYQANEYLAMLELERFNYLAASQHCRPLITIGENLKQGSEAPFAHALVALCHYGLEGEDDTLEKPLHDLRMFDAKHRLAYSLLRAGLIDLKRSKTERAIERATEALDYTKILNRPSEILIANVILATAYNGNPKSKPFQDYIINSAKNSVSGWAKLLAEKCMLNFVGLESNS